MRSHHRPARDRRRRGRGARRPGDGYRQQVWGALMAKGLAGMPASPGIVDGLVHLLRWEVPDVRHRIIHDDAIGSEIKRFHAALEQAKERLHQVRARAEKNAGPEEAAIFDVQLSILDDTELLRQVEELIQQNLGAEKAFDLVLFEWRQQFASHVRPDRKSTRLNSSHVS